MILSFSLANFRSIKTSQTLRLDAREKKSKFLYLEENAILLMKGISCLKVKVIYGPNASGKSNLIKGLRLFHNIVASSFADPKILEGISPFLLSSETENAPSTFEIELSRKDKIFRFGFSVDREKFYEEWLFIRIDGKEYKLYERVGDKMNFNKKRFPEGEKLLFALGKSASVLRHNALFLSVAASFNHPIALLVVEAILGINIVGGVIDSNIQNVAREALKSPEMRLAVKALLQQLGVDVEEVVYLDQDTVPSFDFDEKSEEVTRKLPHPQTIAFTHKAYDKMGQEAKPMAWPVEHGESIGTQKLLWLAPLIIDSIRHGKTLIIDEFESSIHSEVSSRIIELYGGAASNPNNAQLIVVTHDTNLLAPQLLRRDQIDFVEKDEFGASEIYSLADLKGVRNNESFEKSYLVGRYGASPDSERLQIIE